EIVNWLVDVGDHIELNQEIVEVETAKAVVAVPSPFAGTLKEKFGEPGESLEVGEPLCRIEVEAVADDAEVVEDTAETADVGAAAEPGEAEAAEDDEPMQPLVGYGEGKAASSRRGRRRRGGKQKQEPAASGPSGNGQVTDRPLAKPPVRKLAKDLGVDLSEIMPGSGDDGIITREDVHAAAEGEREPAAAAATAEAAPPRQAPQLVSAAAGEKPVPGFRGRTPGEVEEIRGIRKRIVEKMETSRREIPEATTSRTADVTNLWEMRKELTAQAQEDGFDVKITPFGLVMRAAVLALRRFPTLNARIDKEQNEIHLLEHINLGVAVDTDRGLMVPNIKDAHTKSTLQLSLELTDLADKCRAGNATPQDLTGGTFTVNNYGAFGNDFGDPIINHPEGAILGVGAMRERPWVVDGEIQVRRVCTFTLAFDHRICDGGEAGRFVTYVADLCENPSRILLHS
ncbi:MAG: dihydrolipoamide acetyltransferase family protein, partial [Nitriliruptorales bacterium]|nr:dihydrolipoamide acetyltransferase family protein [Nitriliruptorales bacterium]